MKLRLCWLRVVCLLVLLAGGVGVHSSAMAADRPNILWLVVEDMSAHFGCYGETTIQTPAVDRLAEQGVKFSRAYITAPVCSAARSALITGRYQTSIGAHQHRSGRGQLKIQLPDDVVPVPQLFQQAGYYTCNGTTAGKQGKTDYNFEWDATMYDGADWSGRKPGQPFFAQIQLHGGKLRHGGKWAETVTKELGGRTSPEQVKLPPYYPDHPVVRDDWALYLDAVRWTDMEVGRILKRLDDEKIADQTYVFFITDHGISHARGKQFLYEEGVHIPLLVRGPTIKPGQVRQDLVIHIDLAATSLALAGISPPKNLEGQNVLAANYQPREYVISARDRCDETIDHIRCVTTDRYKYIRNFYPDRPYLQPNAYKDHKPIVQTIRQLAAAGKLNAEQQLVTAESRAPEELYDLKSDPFELHNLAGDAAQRETLVKLRETLDGWLKSSGDKGPESWEMYDSDMEVYLTPLRKKDTKRAQEILDNMTLMKKWAKEGK